jgi:DASH complex subunit DAD3
MASDPPHDPQLLASQIALPNDDDGAETLSPLEQEVLDEYARLLGNLNNVRHVSLSIHRALAELERGGGGGLVIGRVSM